jgi:hypothetical protein
MHTALRIVFGYKWDDLVSNEYLRKKANVCTIKQRTLMLAKRYISNAIYNENELINSLILDSIEERKKDLIDLSLIDNQKWFGNEILDANKSILT